MEYSETIGHIGSLSDARDESLGQEEEGASPQAPTAPVCEREFDLFYRTYRKYVYDLCRRRLSFEEDIRDLESVVWTEVYRFFERFRCEDPRRLLYQLIKWRARDCYRRMQRKKQEDYGTELEDVQLMKLMQDARPHAPRPEDTMALQQVLMEEEPMDREILFGRFVEGLTWEELSARHDVHRNTLLRRAKASLKRLRTRLEEVYPQE
ncbi:MAG: hypothetical protein CL920_03470 [Deltaproteobacteria bacterium]|nr:hypothetical protein [Deltaproteobacteria bacterium]|tara:strand:+ start:16527 stop:17150 length:624 start_codon:yes stop_codon:yes gene_type:complete